MKPHLIIKLNDQRAIPQFEYWEDIIADKSHVSKKFTPDIDSIVKDKYHLDFLATQNYRSKKDFWSQDELHAGLNRIYRLILLTNNPEIPQQLIDEISYLPQVASVKMGHITTAKLPDHELVSAQSLSSKYPNNAIFLKEAHAFTQGHPEIKIAILDTGIETGHQEFSRRYSSTISSTEHGKKFKYAKDFVDIIDGAKQFAGDFLDMDDVPDDGVGHGTHVAGIVGSEGRKMPVGVAPQCTLIPIKVLGALKTTDKVVGAGLIDNIDSGIKYAVDQGADVINMSLGIKHTRGGLPHEEVIQYALKKNVSVVAASGNDGRQDKYYPGAHRGVIAVGAADNLGRIASFSTFGGHVSVTAPGVHIYSSSLNNGYALSSGTSQAAPYVSGTIALLKSYAKEKGKTISADLINEILRGTTDKFTNQFKDRKSGFGRINVLDALKMLTYNL